MVSVGGTRLEVTPQKSLFWTHHVIRQTTPKYQQDRCQPQNRPIQATTGRKILVAEGSTSCLTMGQVFDAVRLAHAAHRLKKGLVIVWCRTRVGEGGPGHDRR